MTTTSENLTMLATEVTPSQLMKLLYPDRPWESEPDHAEWFDAATGYKCRIQRSDTSGALCGYVGVFKGHPLHEMRYSDAEWEQGIYVHGGLTYSNTDKNGVHWFGFDTAHSADFCPKIAESMLEHSPGIALRWADHGVYRTWEYVEDEVRKLVRALWVVEKPQ